MFHHLLPNNIFNLSEVIERLPHELTYAHYLELLGDKLIFTKNEMNSVLEKAFCIIRGMTNPKTITEEKKPVKPNIIENIPVVSEKKVMEVITDLKISFVAPEIATQSVLKIEEEVYVPMKDRRCRALLTTSTCNKEITNKGVRQSGFCEECWHPTIEEDHETYDGLREEGLSRNEAAVRAGLFAPPASKREPTYGITPLDKRVKAFQR
jgi:hypothetical protein